MYQEHGQSIIAHRSFVLSNNAYNIVLHICLDNQSISLSRRVRTSQLIVINIMDQYNLGIYQFILNAVLSLSPMLHRHWRSWWLPLDIYSLPVPDYFEKEYPTTLVSSSHWPLQLDPTLTLVTRMHRTLCNLLAFTVSELFFCWKVNSTVVGCSCVENNAGRNTVGWLCGNASQADYFLTICFYWHDVEVVKRILEEMSSASLFPWYSQVRDESTSTRIQPGKATSLFFCSKRPTTHRKGYITDAFCGSLWRLLMAAI